MSGSKARTREVGFTIVELMVAMTLTAIILAAVYNMFITSSSVFHTQEDLATAHYQLQSAMGRVLADIRRAGFGATPNSDIDPFFCTEADSRLQGISIREGAGAEQILFPAQNVFISPDDLVITGNFNTRRVIPGLGSSPNKTIALQVIDQVGPDPALSPYDPTSYPLTKAEFESIFTSGRLVAIRNSYGKSMVLPLAGANYPELHLDRFSVGMGANCAIEGLSMPVQVSPVDLVRYRIVRKNPEVDNDARTQLVREFLKPDGTPLEVPRLVVAENAVDFQVWFMFRNADPGSNVIAADEQPADSMSNTQILVDGSVGARPDLIRSVVVRLAVRTEMEHGDIPHRVRISEEERLTTFDVDGNPANGSAPVVVLTGEVEVPNFSMRELGTL